MGLKSIQFCSEYWQGGESCDLFCLFYTCIRTERVRKLFITTLILNKLSCSREQITCLLKQQKDITVFFVMCSSFSHNLVQRLSLLEIEWKKTVCIETSLRYGLLQKSNKGFCALPNENL